MYALLCYECVCIGQYRHSQINQAKNIANFDFHRFPMHYPTKISISRISLTGVEHDDGCGERGRHMMMSELLKIKSLQEGQQVR